MQGTPTVVHLVRAANGPAPFRAFLDALRGAPAGTDFELVLAMKGFARESDAQPYLELAREAPPDRVVFVSDEGLDLGVYFSLAAELGRDRYCFLNSFSRPLVPGWLQMLDASLALPGVGIVGATGSWASTRSWTAHVLRLPGPYRGVLPAPEVAMRHFMQIDADRSGGSVPVHANALARTRARLQTLAEAPGQMLPFDPFPAYHIRTNAFMISGSVLGGLKLASPREKREAYLLESGRRSITRQLQRRGLRTLVVDRAGAVYDHPSWPLSRTFWQGSQEGLLVADNQTVCYAEGDGERRTVLSRFAWGREADPDLPEMPSMTPRSVDPRR